MPICWSFSRSKPSITIAPEFGKTIEKPLISMVDLYKNIQWWWSRDGKTIEKPSMAMVPWRTLPSHCYEKIPEKMRFFCQRGGSQPFQNFLFGKKSKHPNCLGEGGLKITEFVMPPHNVSEVFHTTFNIFIERFFCRRISHLNFIQQWLHQ